MSTLAVDISHYNAPIEREVESEELVVSGEIPPELEGSYVRNGPNPRGTSAHWFVGDGMLHGIRLGAGRAQRYANRWVRTKTFETGAQPIGLTGKVDLRAGVSNTSVVEHAGRMFALVESSFPCEVTPQLETIGAYDFAGRLRTPMTAHPKRCPITGELHFFGYSPVPQLPALTYHRVDAAGALVESRAIEVPGRTMMHDFAITSGHVIFMDLPVVFDLQRALRGTMPFRWSDDYGARLGIMSREGDRTVRWFDIEPCYVFHVLNAFEDGSRIVIDAVRYEELWRDSADTFGNRALHQWTIDLASGAVHETQLDDLPVEFPRLDDARTGLSYRYGYAVGTLNEGRSGIVKYDLATKQNVQFLCEPGQIAGEFVFVAAPSAAAEDDGWLLGLIYDQTRDASDFVVIEARDLTRVASVHLPQRVPGGFHGGWFPAHA
jgi:carotenoid cleavage dioxygenase